MRFYAAFFLYFASIFAESTKNWTVSDFVWNLGLAQQCDHPIQEFPCSHLKGHYYANIKDGDIIWLQSDFLVSFIKRILPKIKAHFVLVTNNSDVSIPYIFERNIEVKKFISDERLIHWFTQNFYTRIKTDKISPLPIGIDFHTIQTIEFWGSQRRLVKEQEEILKGVIGELRPTNQRAPKILVDWNLHDTIAKQVVVGVRVEWGRPKKQYKKAFSETRAEIFQKLNKECVDTIASKLPRTELWKLKGQYAFSVSPFGGGMDCHRTWEDLALGLIVIVKTSPLDPLFEGLPVIIINDWDEITPKNLKIWLEKYHDAFSNSEYRKRLTNDYWMSKIKQKADEFIFSH